MLRSAVASGFDDAAARLDADGFAILPLRVDEAVRQKLLEHVDRAVTEASSDARRGVGNLRNLLDRVPELRDLLAEAGLDEVVQQLMGPGAFATRGLLFDKVSGANWPMRYHQDLTIAVAERRNVPGFGPWSVKDGVTHAEAPVQVLQQMLAVRVHLDHCDASNGALRVVPGSHRLGRLGPANVGEVRERLGERVCEVEAGGVMVMRPLLLHGSTPAESPEHRRVIHLEMAADALPMGLRWRRRVRLVDGR